MLTKTHLLRNSALSALGTIALVAVPVAAVAQSTSSSWVSEVVITSPRGSFTAPSAVSATRTATAVEEIPQSIQTLTRQLIEDQALQTLSGALVNVSGVTPTSTEQTVLQPPLIRGFPVSYYFDGAPTYQLPAGIADPATLVNVERIEVAKGPTSTLYGGGSGAPLSGIINVVSQDPGKEFGGTVAFRAGSFNTLGADAAINLPVSDKVGLRLAGMTEKADSYIDHIDSRRYAIFPTLAVEIDDKTRLVVRGRYNHLEQREYAGVPAGLTFAPALVIDRYKFAGALDAPRTRITNKQLTANLTHQVSEKLEVSVTASRYEGAFKEYSSFPYGQIAGSVYNFGTAYLPSDTTENYVTGSLTAHLGEGLVRHQVLLGADYDKTRYFGAMYFNPFWATLDYAAARPYAAFGGNPAFFFDQNDRMRTTAVFVQDQIAIGERLDITAGLRWTTLKIQSNVGAVTADTDKRFTPRIGATYRIGKGVSAFAGYAEGFKGVVAGGFYGITPKPETSQSYEGGLKFAAPIKGLTGTVSLYQITRQNVITAHPTLPFVSVQTGEQRSKGVEADLVYEPTPALSVLFNYAYTDAEISKDNTLPVGDRLRAVPKHSGRLAANYRFMAGDLKGLRIGGGLTATSSRELTLPNTIAAKGLALIDAQASYDLGVVRVGLSVVNLAGRKGFEPYQYFGGPYVIPTQPRSAFVSLRTAF